MDKEKAREWIATAVTGVARQTFERTGVDVADLLQASVVRVMMNIVARSGDADLAAATAPIGDFFHANGTRHVCDWLVAARLAEDPWLARVDELGRPLKLMKFGSLPQIVAEADKAMNRRNALSHVSVQSSDEVEVVHAFADEWSVVRLKSASALDREGKRMGHCVGQGAYDLGLMTNTTVIFSLRDPQGKSQATIEFDNAYKRIVQIRGRQNELPAPDHLRRLSLGWPFFGKTDVAASELPPGFAARRSGGAVELATLRSGDVFDGDLDFAVPFGEDFDLGIADGVVIRGNLSIRGSIASRKAGRHPRVTIAAGIVVEGTLNLDRVRLHGFSTSARRIAVGYSTVASLGQIASATASFTATNFEAGALAAARFGGAVDIRACLGLSIDAGTEIRGSLSVAGPQPNPQPMYMVAFEEGFTPSAGASIRILDNVVAFEGALSVSGHLEIAGSKVLSMPSDLSVGGNLTVRATEIDRWPENLVVAGSVTEEGVTTCLDRRPPFYPTAP